MPPGANALDKAVPVGKTANVDATPFIVVTDRAVGVIKVLRVLVTPPEVKVVTKVEA